MEIYERGKNADFGGDASVLEFAREWSPGRRFRRGGRLLGRRRRTRGAVGPHLRARAWRGARSAQRAARARARSPA